MCDYNNNSNNNTIPGIIRSNNNIIINILISSIWIEDYCSFFNDIHISFNMPNGKRYYHKLKY